MTPATTAKRRVPWWALLAANVVSNVGNVLTLVAVPWFVLQTTGSASKTGIVAAMTAFPAIIAGVFGGTIVDRTGFKRMSILADLASGAAIAAIPLLHRTIGIEFWELMLLVFLGALFDAPGNTARQSLLPDLAEMAQVSLERANAAYSGFQRGSFLVGPPLAGILIALVSASNVLWFDTATFAFSAIAIAIAVPSAATQPAPGTDAEGYLSQLIKSFRFVQRDRLILTMMAIVAIVNFITSPLFEVILPVYAREIFGSSVKLGIMMAGFGAGALASTLVYGGIGHRMPRRVTFVGAFVLSMIPTWVLTMTPNLVVSTAALVAIGLASGPINPLLMTIFQERTPADMRGRLFGMIMAISWIAIPLGMLVAGMMIQLTGLRTTLILIATTLGLITLGVLANPVLRSLDAQPAPADESGNGTVSGVKAPH